MFAPWDAKETPEAALAVVKDGEIIYSKVYYKENELIQYGYSRDGKNDCKQLNLGLTVAGDGGGPVLGRVLSGNIADQTTNEVKALLILS